MFDLSHVDEQSKGSCGSFLHSGKNVMLGDEKGTVFSRYSDFFFVSLSFYTEAK